MKKSLCVYQNEVKKFAVVMNALIKRVDFIDMIENLSNTIYFMDLIYAISCSFLV